VISLVAPFMPLIHNLGFSKGFPPCYLLLATWAITGVCAMLLIFLIWTSASHAATISTGNAYINAFGGREYYQASLEIMDDRNRDFNLKRLEECRKSKPVKNSKEAYMECELRAKKSS
jgi:hypothetical protein